ncbi:MAG: transglutaminase family protein, partial [Anaerolineae bacterium]
RPMWVLVFLGLAITLMVRGQAKGLERRWQALGLDYSDELMTTATVIGLALAVAAVAISPLVPALSSRATYDAFWRVLSGPWRQVEDTTGKLFGGLNSPTNRQPMLEGDAATPDVPSDHQVGAGLPLGNDIVMTVKIDDDAPEPWAGEMIRYEEDTVPQRHWRAATYERYTGSGWENGAYTEAEVNGGATLPLPDTDIETRKESHQEFSLRGRTGVLYAVGQPYQFDEPVAVNERTGDDVVSVHSDAYVYEVTSLVPDITVAELDEAGEDYPEWVSERYLALPDLPQRLRDLVAEVLAGADTPYRKARAVEAYLRQFPYDLNVPQAPATQDVVDYFLFDLQRGYCDYYATAMVVMLRQAGVPARLAIGYARGTYDRDRAAWVVKQSDSHAWVEVYFPRYGWIEFEPTSGQSVYSFPAGGFGDYESNPLGVPEAPGVGLRWPYTAQQTTRGAAVGLAAVALLALLVRGGRRLRFGPDRWAKEAYDGTTTAAGWVGVAPGPNETVREFWQRLRLSLAEETIFVSTPWGTEWVWQFDRVMQPLRYVLAAYEQSLFGRGHLSRTVARRAREEAGRVRRHLALLWLARRLGE